MRSATARAAMPPPTRASAESGSMADTAAVVRDGRLMRMKCSSEKRLRAHGLHSEQPSPGAVRDRCSRWRGRGRCRGVFIEGENGRFLAAAAASMKAPRASIAGPGAAGEQRIGAAVKGRRPASVQAIDAGGDALGERLRLGMDSIRETDLHAGGSDHKRDFV